MATHFGYLLEPADRAWWYDIGGDGDRVGRALRENGAQLTNLSAYIDNGALRFSAIMEPRSGAAWWWYYGQTRGQVEQLLLKSSAAVTDLSAYPDTDGSIKFAVIIEPSIPFSSEWYGAGLDADGIVQKLKPSNANNNARLKLRLLSPYVALKMTESQETGTSIICWMACSKLASVVWLGL